MDDRRPRYKNPHRAGRRITFSKRCVIIILTFALIDLQLTYLLAFLEKIDNLKEVAMVIVTEIIGVMLGYFLKSFFETREEEKVRLEEKKTELENQVKDFEFLDV